MAEEKPEYKSEEVGKNFSLFGKYFSTNEIMGIINSTQTSDLTKSAKKIFSSRPTLSIIGSPTPDVVTKLMNRGFP